jgi:hypothetical protein
MEGVPPVEKEALHAVQLEATAEDTHGLDHFGFHVDVDSLADCEPPDGRHRLIADEQAIEPYPTVPLDR